MRSVEQRTQELGRELLARSRAAAPTANRWVGQVLAWCLADGAMKSRVLRFVDVLPSLATPQAVVRHLREYFPSADLRLPAALRLGVALTGSGPLTARAVAAIVEQLGRQVAGQFIIGATLPEAIAGIARLERQGLGFTLDLLGEAVVSEREADAYARRYAEALETLPHPNLSIKPSALTAHFDPLSWEDSLTRALERLVPLAVQAKRLGAFINLDVEQYALRDLTLELARRLALHPALGGYPHLGVVLQAYVQDADRVAAELLEWLRRHRVTMTIRLVKGAYWDTEMMLARQRNWPAPVWETKAQTDACFERLTALLLQHHGTARTAIGSHNIRSLAHALAAAEALNVPPEQWECQLLYGMGDGTKAALAAMGRSVRVYAPCGALIPGMAYLVRRLLENTANESFLRQELSHALPDEQLLAAPVVVQPAAPPAPQGFQNEPPANFALAAQREQFAAALQDVRRRWLGQAHPLLIDGRAVETGEWLTPCNPANPGERLGRVGCADAAAAQRAVAAAVAGWPAWRRRAMSERAAVMQRAAALMRAERMRLAALEVLEVGKTWYEADADVCEAIDYLEYYAQQALWLERGGEVRSVPGEVNRYAYQPRGVAVVIAPWNFPAAIVTGMTSAALVTGHPVIMKPAGPSGIIAAHVARLLHQAGVPASALHYLPGPGGQIGAALTGHPDVQVILFTGSREVGLAIAAAAAQVQPGQRHLKHVVTELGGKNAIIVDADADLDEAVTGVVHSAFGYQGQKCSACSRVIVLDAVYERFVARLTAAVESLRVLPPEDPGCDVGPLIHDGARRRVLEVIAQGRGAAELGYQTPASRLPGEGSFVPPTVFTAVRPDSALAQEEIFGPVLSVLRVRDLTEALAVANNVSYGLTGGIYSRSPRHLAQAAEQLDVGNLYLNRAITGAVVGRQPFGGFKLSGGGTKAGGPDYLRGLVQPKTITENTARHGLPV